MGSTRRISSLITACFFSLLLLSACSGGRGNETTTVGNTDSTSISDKVYISEPQAVEDSNDEEFTANAIIKEKDLDTSYDSSVATSITLSDSGSKVGGSGATISGNIIKITAEGTYIISGTLSNGRISVEAPDSADIHIILRDMNISCSDYAPLAIVSADNVYVTLDEHSNNSLSDGSSYTLLSDTDNTDSVIFSKADLTLNGYGTLTVNGNSAHGICSKDDLIITGGTYNITTVSSGICGKDSLSISGGTFTVDAGTNAIKTSNNEDSDKGNINIYGGTFNLTSGTDGVEAQESLNIYDGSFNIESGGGSANSSTSNSAGWGLWGKSANSSSGNSASAKGLKADGNISISGGTIKVDSSDDSVHSNADITVSGGTLSLSSGDDGIHASEDLLISDGTINIEKSYEGLEGITVTISGGSIIVIAQDDGINSAGGSDTADIGRPGMNPFSTTDSGNYSLTISGGYTVIDADGDGVDSNGVLTVSGGVLLISGPTNDGNGALDYQTRAVITGGYVMAAGSSGMAEGFESDSSQCSACYTFDSSVAGGTNVTLLDSTGNVIVSFTPKKNFSNIVVSAPSLSLNEEYTIQTGGIPSNADANGFSDTGIYSGGSTAVQYTQSQKVYSNKSFGGMFGPGGAGGPGGRR